MSSAELIVAKAALSGALFRADPRPCSRDEIESMLALLNSTITECSPSNVQKFKQWALVNLVSSSSRIAPFTKYLIALSSTFGRDGESDANDANGDTSQPKKQHIPSAKRRRLHILYIFNDLLYYTKFRIRDHSFAEKLAPTLPTLVRSASSFPNAPKHIGKLHDLIQLWDEQGYFAHENIEKLRAAVDETHLADGSSEANGKAANAPNLAAKAARAAPFIMPAMHGDPSTPWYDLPAGNWLTVLEPNSTRPMNPAMIKPLVLAAGPADKDLADAVKRLLNDVDKIYSKEATFDEPASEINQMGEAIKVDEVTGEISGDTYYGWSRSFCEKMKMRKRKGNAGSEDMGRGRSRRVRSSRSYSRSPSRSRSPYHSRSRSRSNSSIRPSFKRPRHSSSPDSRPRSRSQRRSWSRSRSPRPGKKADGYDKRSHQRSHSRSEGRPRSRSGSLSDRYEPKSPSYGLSRSPSQSPGQQRNYPPAYAAGPPLPSLPPQPPSGNGFMPIHHPPPPPIPYPHPVPHPLGYGQMPVPPPPPPNYQGHWPPPPPMGGPPPQNFYPGAAPPPFIPGAWPPPPPPPQQFPPSQGGTGGYHGMPGGRGGYGRGNGRW